MQLIQTMSLALLSLMMSVAHAETAQETAVRKLAEQHLGEGVKIESITKTPYAGLYEIRSNGEIVYTDEKAQFLFMGNVVDLKTRQDYTKARLEEINKVKFSELPLELAMKQVKGNGKRVIAVFEDPNCGYCKRLRKTLQGMDNLTIYTFMFNILSEDSVTKSKNIWCASDRIKAWDDWMLNGKAAPAAPANCISPHDKVQELGKRLKITGTPTIFFTDGSRIPGAVDAQGLEAKFSTIK